MKNQNEWYVEPQNESHIPYGAYLVIFSIAVLLAVDAWLGIAQLEMVLRMHHG